MSKSDKVCHKINGIPQDNCNYVIELQAELDKARKTNQQLNRRCQAAESAAKVTIDDCERQGVSLGRTLANIKCDELQAKLDEANKQLDNARDYLWSGASGPPERKFIRWLLKNMTADDIKQRARKALERR